MFGIRLNNDLARSINKPVAKRLDIFEIGDRRGSSESGSMHKRKKVRSNTSKLKIPIREFGRSGEELLPDETAAQPKFKYWRDGTFTYFENTMEVDRAINICIISNPLANSLG